MCGFTSRVFAVFQWFVVVGYLKLKFDWKYLLDLEQLSYSQIIIRIWRYYCQLLKLSLFSHLILMRTKKSSLNSSPKHVSLNVYTFLIKKAPQLWWNLISSRANKSDDSWQFVYFKKYMCGIYLFIQRINILHTHKSTDVRHLSEQGKNTPRKVKIFERNYRLFRVKYVNDA